MENKENSRDFNSTVVAAAGDVTVAAIQDGKLSKDEIPAFLANILRVLRSGEVSEAAGQFDSSATAVTPIGVNIEDSVKDDHIVCLEDGKRFKSLKRHLREHYNLTPEEYRLKWGLPGDYPMVAPAYSRTRSKLAKEAGLGSPAARKPTRTRARAKTSTKGRRR